ncbi:MAG: glutathione S-transferase [Oscillatoriaceae cyanobacterium Prado104]|jgi:glutathione S-transferase|nr:glutathione S-transferase [Oscillatoriaceae cyanobacterium Prado104]
MMSDCLPATYPILYSFRRCPYAMRARLALAISNRSCELREVVLRDKPPEMLAVSPKGTVPVLIDAGGQVIDESIDIMLWALQQNDPEQWLTPDRASVAEMLELIAQFDGKFKYHLDRYKYPDRYAGVDAKLQRDEGSVYLEKLNAQLCATISATKYLYGNNTSLADMAIAPFVRQFAQTDRTWFNEQPWPQLQAWLAQFAGSAIYQRIMYKYPKWESGNPGVMFPPQSGSDIEVI